MAKWIKNLSVSKRLRAASKRIKELEAENAFLKNKINYLEETFIPIIPDEVLEKQYAATRT